MTDAVQTARLTRAIDALQGAGKRKGRQLRRRANRAMAAMSLDSYVAWINRDAEGFELMGADKWRERGVTTAVHLGRILDAEARRDLRKARYDD